MAVSTVKLNGTTLMTVNDTTATAEDVASGEYFYGADGVKTVGTASGGGGYTAEDVFFGQIAGPVTIQGSETTSSPASGDYNYRFYKQTGVTSVTVTGVNTMGISTFQGCTGITTASMDSKYVGDTTFCDCTNLVSVSLPNVDTDTWGGSVRGRNIFTRCSKLTSVYAPKMPGATSSAYAQAFSQCTSLEVIDLPALRGIAGQMFNGCTKLATVVLRRTDAVVALSNVNAFGGTPFASGKAGGTIYIPTVMYDHLGDGTALDYQAATNWSTVYGYGTITWAKIEGSIYE